MWNLPNFKDFLKKELRKRNPISNNLEIKNYDFIDEKMNYSNKGIKKCLEQILKKN